MKLEKRSYLFLSVLAGAALTGLAIVQFSLLRGAYRQEQKSFRSNVRNAMASIVRKMETRETADRIVQIVLDSAGARTGIGSYTITVRDTLTSSSREGLYAQYLKQVYKDSSRIVFDLDQPRQVQMVVLDSLDCPRDTLNAVQRKSSSYEFVLADSVSTAAQYTLQANVDDQRFMIRPGSGTFRLLPADSTARNLRWQIVEKVISELDLSVSRPVTDRIRPAFLDSVIHVTLEEHGLPSRFAYGIITSRDSLVHAAPSGFARFLRNTPYRTRLFPHDLFVENNRLAIYFPGEGRFLFGQIGLMAFTVSLFLLVIAAVFAVLLRLTSRQKRFSVRLKDFINNMTHEFKTPISTMALAGENLSKPDVRSDPSRLDNYSRIILEESGRMRSQVEKILQMAALEKGELVLKREPVDVHTLLSDLAGQFQMRVEARDGHIHTELGASCFVLSGDPDHLSCIFRNLLDNAVKFTRGTPDIHIVTENMERALRITVADNGIGIPPEHQKQIFETYYRVPFGDVHNVKGFGLGLSYVKLMTEALGGRVSLTSIPGRGSRFSITLPLNKNGAGKKIRKD
jgi:two-component system phosphate regulon sensor histidine kinase PhoR